jgi:hypothetical protein
MSFPEYRSAEIVRRFLGGTGVSPVIVRLTGNPAAGGTVPPSREYCPSGGRVPRLFIKVKHSDTVQKSQ